MKKRDEVNDLKESGFELEQELVWMQRATEEALKKIEGGDITGAASTLRKALDESKEVVG